MLFEIPFPLAFQPWLQRQWIFAQHFCYVCQLQADVSDTLQHLKQQCTTMVRYLNYSPDYRQWGLARELATLNPNFIDITSKTDLILLVQVQTITSHESQINKKYTWANILGIQQRVFANNFHLLCWKTVCLKDSSAWLFFSRKKDSWVSLQLGLSIMCVK